MSLCLFVSCIYAQESIYCSWMQLIIVAYCFVLYISNTFYVAPRFVLLALLILASLTYLHPQSISYCLFEPRLFLFISAFPSYSSRNSSFLQPLLRLVDLEVYYSYFCAYLHRISLNFTSNMEREAILLRRPVRAPSKTRNGETSGLFIFNL